MGYDNIMSSQDSDIGHVNPRRERLLDAALQVFAEKGLHGATTKDLASAAGVAPGLIYHYFSSKEELLFEVIRKRGFLPQMRTILSEAPADRPAAEVLRLLCHGFANLLAERAALVRVVVREAQGNAEMAAPFATMVAEGVGLLSEFLRARTASGELREHDMDAAARTILFAIVMGQLTDSSDKGFRERLVELTLLGLLPRGID